MTTFEKFTNIAGVVVLSILGIAALIGVLCFGAVHQLVIAGICAIVVWVLGAEVRREEKKERNP